MKTTSIFLVVLSCLFSACSTEEAIQENNYSPSSLEFRVSFPDELKKSTTVISTFSGTDIAWFNESTGELKFNTDSEALGPVSFLPVIDLSVYSESDSLYSMHFMFTTSVMSNWIDSPVMEIPLWKGSTYIRNGYPERNLAEYDATTPWRVEREKNWNALVQSEGWQLFIQQLKKEGRYRK